MKIIISPAMKMRTCDDHGFEMSIPQFEKEAEALYSELLSFSPKKLQKLYGCSDRMLLSIADQMERDRQRPEHHGPVSPALLSFNGIAFRTMSPDTFTDDDWDYVSSNLYILSGLFGVLKPLDAIWPYRLEMKSSHDPSLYDFWRPKTDPLFQNETIVDLASQEYSSLLPADADVLRIHFYEEDSTGKRKNPSVYAKTARGAMVRWMAENRVENPEQLKNFRELGYRLDEDSSSDRSFVFVRSSTK